MSIFISIMVDIDHTHIFDKYNIPWKVRSIPAPTNPKLSIEDIKEFFHTAPIACSVIADECTDLFDDPLDFDNFMNEIAPYAYDHCHVLVERENDTLCLVFFNNLIYRMEVPKHYFAKTLETQIGYPAIIGCDEDEQPILEWITFTHYNGKPITR